MEEARGYGRDRDASFEVGEDWVLHRSCGFRQALVRQPLLGVCGASGSGKTTIAPLVAAGVSQAAVLEGDLLWLAGRLRPRTTICSSAHAG